LARLFLRFPCAEIYRFNICRFPQQDFWPEKVRYIQLVRYWLVRCTVLGHYCTELAQQSLISFGFCIQISLLYPRRQFKTSGSLNLKVISNYLHLCCTQSWVGIRLSHYEYSLCSHELHTLEAHEHHFISIWLRYRRISAMKLLLNQKRSMLNPKSSLR
jgi:hypothetical protein